MMRRPIEMRPGGIRTIRPRGTTTRGGTSRPRGTTFRGTMRGRMGRRIGGRAGLMRIRPRAVGTMRSFLGGAVGTVSVRIRLGARVSRSNTLYMSVDKRRVKVLVNGEKRALSSLRCLTGHMTGGRRRNCMEMGLSARGCHTEERRALERLTGGVTRGMGEGEEPMTLRPVGPCREEVVRSTLRSSPCIVARDRKRRPFEGIIVALGGWCYL